MMNMYVMLMIMLWDFNACLTPRGVTALFFATFRMAPSPAEEVSGGEGYINVVWDEALVQA
jgi:hypothetical protein